MPPGLLNILFDNVCLAARWHRPKAVGNVMTMLFRWVGVSIHQDNPKKSLLALWEKKDARLLKLFWLCMTGLRSRCKETLALMEELFTLDKLDFLDTFEYFLVANCEEVLRPNVIHFMSEKAKNALNCADDIQALLRLFTHMETRIAAVLNP